MKKIITIILSFTALIFIMSCGGADKTPNKVPINSLATIVNDTTQNNVTYNIPSPTETFIILKISGVKFDKSLLNSPNNISKYVTSFSKAINLGSYSADLAFCFLYRQNQNINQYFKNINELTASLGVEDGSMQSLVKRVRSNSDNLDSMMQIVSEASVNTKLYLNENERNITSTLITAGGWIEGMYIIANIADKTKKKEIVGLVADQKNSINSLIKMLQQFESDSEVAVLLTDIKGIAVDYETLKHVKETLKHVKETAKVSTENNVESIGNSESNELSDVQFKSILEKVTALRNKLTN